jgi:hypothetical protein
MSTNLPFIIGVSGYARSGKDSVGEVLRREYGFVRRAFADPMRDALYRLDPPVTRPGRSELFSLARVVDDLGWEQAKVECPEVRPMLQRMGTEVGREMFGQNVWVEMVMFDIATTHLTEGASYFVLTDLRYPNELEALLARGGKAIRVERPGVNPAGSHLTETALDGAEFSAAITNDGTLADLKQKVLDVVEPWGPFYG